ncbi:hypothetical protein BWK67_09250, partial [Campylobacter fetus]
LGGGENTVTVAPDAAAVALTTIDLSGLSATGGTLEGTITHNAAQVALTTIKGSAGNDTITIGKANAGLTITGGEGNDTFVVTAAKVTADGQTDLTTITDFRNGDKISFGAAVTYANKGSLDKATYATLALAVAHANADDTAGQIVGFTYDGDNYLFYNAAKDADTIKSNDILVKLTGTTVDLDSLTVSTNDIVFA